MIIPDDSKNIYEKFILKPRNCNFYSGNSNYQDKES